MSSISKMPPRRAFGPEELEAVKELFEYYWKKGTDFGYQGDYETLYTDAFVKFLGVGGYADAVCTGTAALFVAVAALQLPRGSHVLVSPITDPGTLNAIIMNGLVPYVVDAEPDSFNMGVKEFEERLTNQVKAVMVVHASGNAAPIDEIAKIAKNHGIYVIEDCSQAHSAKCNGQNVGTFGAISAFSTMFGKNHSTGGCGGVIFTRDFERYKLIRSHADRGKPFFSDNFDEKDFGANLFPALNFNIDEISCAIGLKSLAKLNDVTQRRLKFLYTLKEALEKHSKVCRMLSVSENDSPFYKPIKVDTTRIKCSKVEFAMALGNEGITINPHYKNVVCQWPWVKPYLGDDFSTQNAINIRDNSFNLLFNENFGSKELEIIMEAIRKTEQKFLR